MKKFNLGDRVKLINPYYFDKEVGLKNGSIGTVVDVRFLDGYVIKFDNWHNGGGEDRSIWLVEDYKLEKVEEQK